MYHKYYMIRFSMLINQHDTLMNAINKRRQWWLIVSLLMFASVIWIILKWDWFTSLHNIPIWWAIVSLLAITCISWWLWTLKFINQLLDHRRTEYELIDDLLREIKDLNILVKELTVDNTK